VVRAIRRENPDLKMSARALVDLAIEEVAAENPEFKAALEHLAKLKSRRPSSGWATRRWPSGNVRGSELTRNRALTDPKTGCDGVERIACPISAGGFQDLAVVQFAGVTSSRNTTTFKVSEHGGAVYTP